MVIKEDKEDKVKRLMKMKEQIDQAKSRADRIRGTIESLESQMMKQYGCKDVAFAKKKLDQMDTELRKAEKEFSEGVGVLEEAYAWQ